MCRLTPSLFQPQCLSPGLVRAIECIHSEGPLTLEDKALILAYQEELDDHITAEARVVLDAVVNEHRDRSLATRGHCRNVPEGDITSTACTILDFLERNGNSRVPTARAHLLPPNPRPSIDRVRMLPRPVALVAAEASRLPTDLSRQVEAESSMKAIEEDYIRLMIELGRAERERKNKNN